MWLEDMGFIYFYQERFFTVGLQMKQVVAIMQGSHAKTFIFTVKELFFINVGYTTVVLLKI